MGAGGLERAGGGLVVGWEGEEGKEGREVGGCFCLGPLSFVFP